MKLGRRTKLNLQRRDADAAFNGHRVPPRPPVSAAMLKRALNKISASKSQEVCIHCREVKAVWFVCSSGRHEEPLDVLCEVRAGAWLLACAASAPGMHMDITNAAKL